MNIDKVKITPAVAKEWLDLVPAFQRALNQKRVDAIAYAITQNEWRENGATIVFNRKGELIDGQHRLQAILQAGRTVYTFVVKGVDSTLDTFHTIDDCKPRTVADFLQCTNRNLMASVAGFYWQTTNYSISSTMARVPVVDAVKLITPFIPDIERRINLCYKAGKIIGMGSFLVFLDFYYRTFLKIPEPVMDEFVMRLGDGLDLKAGSPIVALRNRMRLGPNVAIPRIAKQAMVIKALNSFIAGENLLRVAYHSNEEFPEMVGYSNRAQKNRVKDRARKRPKQTEVEASA